MDLLPVLGLIAALFVKEAGVPIPVPGDVLVIGAGVAAAGTGLAAPVELAGILVAGFAGGSLQFLIVRGTFRARLLGLLARLGVSPERLDTLAGWLRRRGSRGVAAARATPGVRVGAIAASGIADLRYGVFLPGLVAGNTLFIGGHFALGYLIGPPALTLLAGIGSGAVLVGGLLVLAALGAVGWRLLSRRRAQAPVALPSGTPLRLDLAGYAAWAEAACPACLAVTFIGLESSRVADAQS
jgi:membrane-associated protein